MDKTNTIMLAFYLPSDIAEQIATKGGAPPEDLHLTLALAGVDSSEITDIQILKRILSIWSAKQSSISGKISGIGIFNNEQSNGTYPYYASFDSASLPRFRQRLVNVVELAGFKTSKEHGFTPHITLNYVSASELPAITVNQPIEVAFNELSLVFGQERFSFNLGNGSSRSKGEKMPTNYLRAYRADTPKKGQAGESMTFAASTPGTKRDGKDLEQSRWFLDNYQKNPVILWAHDYRGSYLPIGRATRVAVEADKLIADIVFDQADDFAKRIEQKYRDGYLNTVSVGWSDIQTDGRKMYELLDISAVPVPGDPDALLLRQQMGLRQLNSDPFVFDYDTLAQKIAASFDTPEGLERAGATISARNLSDLQKAYELIGGVIERAKKKATGGESGERGNQQTESKTETGADTDTDAEASAGAVAPKVDTNTEPKAGILALESLRDALTWE